MLILLPPISCGFLKSLKELFGFEEKPYIPQGTHAKDPLFVRSSLDMSKSASLPLQQINYLDEIKSNSTEGKCIDSVLRNATKDPGNATEILIAATNLTVVVELKDCYDEKISLFAWWDDFVQTDYWKLFKNYHLFIIIAFIAILSVITLLITLCCVICKRSKDDSAP